MALKARTKSRIAFSISAVLIALVLAVVGAILWMDYRASHLLPEDTAYVKYDGELFPEIDWEYWQGINPDVIGWVTVPDTNIDYPIVQAPASDPSYYLYHDVYKDWNYCGCPYLDAGCAEDGLDSLNATIFGHHLRNNTMFSMFSEFGSESYAKEHSTILIQTPTSKRVLDVNFVKVINASVTLNQLDFENQTAYEEWYAGYMEGSKVLLSDTIPQHDYMFVTCSYTLWANERTLVVASERYGALTVVSDGD